MEVKRRKRIAKVLLLLASALLLHAEGLHRSRGVGFLAGTSIRTFPCHRFDCVTTAARREVVAARAKKGDDQGDEDRELSILEAEQARLRAELEAARLKAQLAKLQKEKGVGGNNQNGSSSNGRRERDKKTSSGWEDDPFGGPDQPVSRKTGLKPAVPLSAKGPWAGRRRPSSSSSSSPLPPSFTPSSSTPRGSEPRTQPAPSSPLANAGGIIGTEKEARYVEVVEELVSALQDMNKDSKVDVKSLVKGLVTSRQQKPQDGAAINEGRGGQPGGATFDEGQVLKAIRGGLGNALVKRLIEESDSGFKDVDSDNPPSRLERLAAWGSLVVKTISSNKYLLTAEKVLGMKELADRLLPRADFGPSDLTMAHLAIIREVGQNIVDEYPEIRRRRGNMLYVLLNLPLGFRGVDNVHREEVAIGQSISMESSIGQGCRTVFETTLLEAMPSSTDMITDEAFRRAVRGLGEFTESARHVLTTTKLPAEDALKGVSFFLVPWLRRVVKRTLEDGAASNDVAVARLSMVMELARHAAECMAAVKVGAGIATSDERYAEAFESVVQQMLADKVNGIGVELSSSARQTILMGYLRSWVTSCLLGRNLPVAWVDGEGRIKPGDIGAWDLARQVLALSEVQLLFVAKETVPRVVGELMADVLMNKEGEWPNGYAAFTKDFDRVYRRLKYDKYEGNFARCKAVRVLADIVLDAPGGGEEQRTRAVEWGCETLELDLAEFEQLADEQATFELQTEILDNILGPGADLGAAEVADKIAVLAARLRLRPESVSKATAAAVQVHIGNLAARALFADMEGQPAKAFKEMESTLTFIKEDAELLAERFNCTINPIARIPDDDGLQLANICTKMLSRRQYADAARAMLEILGYSDRIY